MTYKAFFACPHCNQWESELPAEMAIRIVRQGLSRHKTKVEQRFNCIVCNEVFGASDGLTFRRDNLEVFDGPLKIPLRVIPVAQVSL